LRTSIAIVVAGACALVASCGGDGMDGAEAMERLHIAEADAQRLTVQQLTSGDLPYYAVSQAFKALDGDARADVVGGAAAWAKAYLASDAFAAEYEAMRERNKPIEPEFDESVDDELKRTIAKQLDDLEQTRRGLSNLPDETREALEETLRASAKAFEDPQMIEMQRAGIVEHRTQELAAYETAVGDWQRDYPEELDDLVALRLREFLDTTANMDFDADLEERNGKLVFEDAELEAKPAEWKVYFRAGEEAVTAARDVASEWLDEID
jgi:hypothetical protein